MKEIRQTSSANGIHLPVLVTMLLMMTVMILLVVMVITVTRLHDDIDNCEAAKAQALVSM